jgi:hypothetical protein
MSVLAGHASRLPAIVVGLTVLFILVVAAVVIGWRQWGRSVVARPVYRLAVENIRITPSPPWIRTDIRAEVVRDNALTDLSIFDKDVTIRVYQAFELHPWIARVKRVSKHPPARLDVDLEYRRPVAWVEVPAGIMPGNEGGVVPVDADSVVLPSRDFTEQNLADYLWISVSGITPFGQAGAPWGDPRVAGAARIATLLEDCWRELQLTRIRVPSDDTPARYDRPPIYELETQQQRRIIWGHAPGIDVPGEPAVSVKRARLQRLAGEGGDVDKSAQQTLDLRSL